MTPIQLFVRGCKQRLCRLKVADSTGVRLSGGLLLTTVIVLRRLLRRAGVVRPDQQMIGVLLPPSVGAVLANLGIGLSGKVAVNLNYAFSADTVDHCIDQCRITHVLTSRHFLKRRPFELNAKLVYLEDLEQQSTWFDKLGAVSQAYLLPAFVLERVFGLEKTNPNDLMAVLFTSGTTGNPKGVMLSHNNIAASVNAIRRTYRVDKTDVTLGILPFFHAFGYTATMWLPLATDMAAVYHFDPFGTKAIGKLARKYSATVLYATPTFLKLYVRRCDQGDLASLDLAVVGAEKLGEELAVAFAGKFGATPVEGYGTTELSPWAAVNVPSHRTFETGVVGSKLGTVGRVLPEMEFKIVDPESRDELKTGEAGLLLVKGPNVMLGYLNQPDKTAEVIQNGWYDTGDVAKLDSDGFITITGRQSRFSKIGGETVPHEKVERLIGQIVGGHETPGEQRVAVTAIADSKKGERLIVVYKTLSDHSPDEITKELSVLGLPNLWIPRPDDFIEVDAIPLTSMGKVDLGALKKIAADRDRSMML